MESLFYFVPMNYFNPTVVLILSYLNIINGQMNIILQNNWSFTQADSNLWKPCTIPGTCFTALLENHQIPDPYFADNESKVQWVNATEWWFKSTFELDSIFLHQENIHLECPGLDTYASIYLNGVLIGSTDNAFRNWNFDIKKNLKSGLNELLVKFQSTEVVANALYSSLETKLPGESRVMVRKPQYQFGWDFGPKLIGCGITQAISLHGWNSINFYDASVHTLSIQDSFAELKLNARFFIQDTEASYRIQIALGDQKFSFPVQSLYGMQNLKRFFTFDHPELWWPNEFGRPNLYETILQILKDDQIIFEKKWKTGIRTIELHHELDPKGLSFYFLVNGSKVFCKGSNYIPQDILYPHRSDHASLIQTAVDCHFNMLRIWGGGHYENDSFYEACDASGIMVWQDFMYACAMYPGDTSFLMNATLEAEQQVERLSKHACIALWCGNNESSEGWHRWGWQDDIPTKQRERIWNEYLTLFDVILPEAVHKFSNKTSYWTSSPLYGRGDDRFTRNGDAHDWGLWHDEMPFEKLEKRIPRFMSEFGFQSWPSLQTITQFASASELDPESKSLLNHQKHTRGNKIIKEYLDRDYPKPESFNDLIYLSQIMQAEGISRILKSHRLAKPYCMGSLYWQFNDCWPGISWSGLDYFGRWKALQFAVKSAFEPILYTAKYADDAIQVYAISDLPDSVSSSCEIFFQDFSGNPIFYDQFESLIPANKAIQVYSAKIPLKKLDFYDTHYIYLKWKYHNQEYHQSILLEKYKNLKLINPEIAIKEIIRTKDGYAFTVSASYFAKSVYLDHGKDSFFPNYFDINPGERIQVNCQTTDPVFDLDQLKIQSLFNFIR